MRIALPTIDGKLCPHFGHCEEFVMFKVDKENKKILERENLNPPPHQPGILPNWLKEKKVDLIIAGGIGRRAQMHFNNSGIKVLFGAPAEEPEKLIELYINDKLKTDENLCDH